VFCKSRPDLSGPDIQFHILPATMDVQKLLEEQKMELEKRAGPDHRAVPGAAGEPRHIRIKSPDAAVYPAIRPTICPTRSTRRWRSPR
jgi:choline dehydrogenase